MTAGRNPADLVAEAEAQIDPHVGALLRRLAEKDAYVEGHARRVALLAVRVGQEMRLPRERLRRLALAALLKDIGKLSVPDAILQKPGPLDEAEFDLVRRDPTLAYGLLGEHGVEDGVRRLVLNHHERLDGSGYPRGVGEDELDVDTRILSACDVYDALVSERVYRPAWTEEQALQLVREEAYEELLDARCVEALERVVVREHGLALGVPV